MTNKGILYGASEGFYLITVVFDTLSSELSPGL